jgi:hypothetical protein
MQAVASIHLQTEYETESSEKRTGTVPRQLADEKSGVDCVQNIEKIV